MEKILINSKKKTLIITGSNGSVGLYLSKKLKKKFNLIKLDKSLPKIKSSNFFKINLKNEKSVGKFFDKLEKKKIYINCIINCAGMFENFPIIKFNRQFKLETHKLSDFRKIVENNLYTSFLILANYSKYLINIKKKGQIINFSSISSRGNIGQIAYSVAKSAIETLSLTATKELSKYGITVNTLSPGFIDTISTKKKLTNSKINLIKNKSPSQNLIELREIFLAIEFLIKAKNVKGAVIDINDGYQV